MVLFVAGETEGRAGRLGPIKALLHCVCVPEPLPALFKQLFTAPGLKRRQRRRKEDRCQLLIIAVKPFFCQTLTLNTTVHSLQNYLFIFIVF